MILSALMPESFVRVVWKPSDPTATTSTTQVTGSVLETTAELLRIQPLQGNGKRPKSIHLDRIHSVVVIREGDAAAERRRQAAHELRLAAVDLDYGEHQAARAHLALAFEHFPGAEPDRRPTWED